MGEAAPKFGSTPELSTLQGFAVGTWRQTVEVDSPGNALIQSRQKFQYYLLTLGKDGKATAKMSDAPKCFAHGTWAVQGDAVAISFTDIDGLSFEEVEARFQKKLGEKRNRSYVPHRVRVVPSSSSGLGIAGDRHFLAGTCEFTRSLAVAEDGKSLKPVLPSGAHEKSSVTIAWVRVK
jgi:hypothetical protein